MNEIEIHHLIDSTEKTKHEAGANMDRINFFSTHVPKHAIIKIDGWKAPKVGDKVFSLGSGSYEFELIEVDENKNYASIRRIVKGREEFYNARLNELKTTPWQQWESNEFYARFNEDRKKISEIEEQVRFSYDQRRALAKEFTGK